MEYPKKLIEVALPLDDINAASSREKSIRHGHPSTLHLWWARRPLAAARAVLFAQLVNDPGGKRGYGNFKGQTKEDAQKERDKLFDIIRDLVKWENINNEEVLEKARTEIRKSWKETCEITGEDPDKLPAFHDPFAGGGAIPLEAQRLGLEAYASDLNPVAVLINKAMIEIPPKFVGQPPVGPLPKGAKQSKLHDDWSGSTGLAEDVRRYGQWVQDEAFKRIGHLYPQVEITKDMAKDRTDLKPFVGQKLTIIAWLWARTVKSPNPICSHVDVPLVTTFILSNKEGKEAYVQPVVEGGSYQFTVKVGRLPAEAKNGTKLARGANFRCVVSQTPIEGDYIKAEGRAGRIGAKLMAVVAEGPRSRIYIAPTQTMELIATKAEPTWFPEGKFVEDARAFTPFLYGISHWRDLFTERQIVTLATFAELVSEIHGVVESDAKISGKTLAEARTYAAAVCLYLAFAVSKTSNRANNLSSWMPSVQCPGHLFRRHALPMTWDFSEANIITGPSGSFASMLDGTADALQYVAPSNQQ